MNGTPTLYVDPYGNIFWAKTIKDIRSNLPAHEADDGSDLFSESVAEDLESASEMTRDSSAGNFLAGRFSGAFLSYFAGAALFGVVVAAVVALLIG